MKSEMRIFLASSWKNREKVRAIAIELRVAGHNVYDFTDPRYRSVPPIPLERFSNLFDPAAGEYRDYLNRREWVSVMEKNKQALNWCDAVILMLPCGLDAHADAYYAHSLGKTLMITGHPDKGERSFVHLWADKIMSATENPAGVLRTFERKGAK